MLRVLELAIISIVLTVTAILSFLYLQHMIKTGQEVQKLKQILQDLETTFIYLKPTRYNVCFKTAKVEIANSTLMLDNKVLVVKNVVRIYIGYVCCDCIWYRPWLCFNVHKLCGVIDLSRLPESKYYILHTSTLCGYVNVWVEKHGDVMIVHIS